MNGLPRRESSHAPCSPGSRGSAERDAAGGAAEPGEVAEDRSHKGGRGTGSRRHASPSRVRSDIEFALVFAAVLW